MGGKDVRRRSLNWSDWPSPALRSERKTTVAVVEPRLVLVVGIDVTAAANIASSAIDRMTTMVFVGFIGKEQRCMEFYVGGRVMMVRRDYDLQDNQDRASMWYNSEKTEETKLTYILNSTLLQIPQERLTPSLEHCAYSKSSPARAFALCTDAGECIFHYGPDVFRRFVALVLESRKW